MAEGVWKTIKGRHVFIRNGESLADAMKKKKEYIEKNRQRLVDKAESTRSGYFDKQFTKDADNRWWTSNPEYKKLYAQKKSNWGTEDAEPEYLTSKGTFTKDINQALTVSANARYDEDKKFETARKKGNIKHYDVTDVRVKEYGLPDSGKEDLDNFIKVKNERADEKLRRGITEHTFDSTGDARDTQIDGLALDRFKAQAKTIVAGNQKTAGTRAEKAKQLKNDLNNYYKKHSVEVNENDFKKIDRPLMQDAYNDLVLTGIQSRDAEENYKRIKSKANNVTPMGRVYQDRLELLKGNNAKRQIEILNNTEYYDKDGYTSTINYHPETGSTYTSVHNLNRRDNMSYPDVYEIHSYNEPGEKEHKYGVNWSAMGTMSAENTDEYAKRLNKAANYARNLSKKETEIRDILSNRYIGQVIQMFTEQGYSLETARKMAREYMMKRKK